MDSEPTMLSRSGGHDELQGKKIYRLDIPVSEETHDAVIALATLAGIPKAEYARSMIERNIFGELHLLRMISCRKRGVQGSNLGGSSE